MSRKQAVGRELVVPPARAPGPPSAPTSTSTTCSTPKRCSVRATQERIFCASTVASATPSTSPRQTSHAPQEARVVRLPEVLRQRAVPAAHDAVAKRRMSSSSAWRSRSRRGVRVARPRRRSSRSATASGARRPPSRTARTRPPGRRGRRARSPAGSARSISAARRGRRSARRCGRCPCRRRRWPRRRRAPRRRTGPACGGAPRAPCRRGSARRGRRLLGQPRRQLLGVVAATGSRRSPPRRRGGRSASTDLRAQVDARHDAVDEVRPVERADQHARIAQPQLRDDVGAHALGGGRRVGVQARVGKAVAERGELAILRPEIVPPLADAVRLVDGEARAPRRAPRARGSAASAAVRARRTPGDSGPTAISRSASRLSSDAHAAVQRRGRVAAVAQPVDLVLHQRDQRRDDDVGAPGDRPAAPGSRATCRRRSAAPPASRAARGRPRSPLAAAAAARFEAPVAGDGGEHRIARRRFVHAGIMTRRARPFQALAGERDPPKRFVSASDLKSAAGDDHTRRSYGCRPSGEEKNR